VTREGDIMRCSYWRVSSTGENHSMECGPFPRPVESHFRRIELCTTFYIIISLNCGLCGATLKYLDSCPRSLRHDKLLQGHETINGPQPKTP
jgi:hypothetical protein